MSVSAQDIPMAVAAARSTERGSVHETSAPRWLSSGELVDGLLAAGKVSADASQRAIALHRQTGVPPLAALLRLNAVAETTLYEEAARLMRIPLLPMPTTTEAAQWADAIVDACARLGLAWGWLSDKGMLVMHDGDGWIVAMRELAAADWRSVVLRKARQANAAVGVGRLSWRLITPSTFERLRASVEQRDQRAQRLGPAANDDLRTLRELAEEGPTIEMVNSVLSRAVTQRASDVHFEAEEFDFCVRFRVDGEMIEQARQPRALYDAVACRLKILSNLDIAERRLPQDGRLDARVNGESFDIRVSVLPAAHGESIVLRLLRQERRPSDLADLGMSAMHAATFRRWIGLSNGIVLVTGPTGSGKSTTLYTALSLANDRTQKIVTVEDPVEYRLAGLTQLQVNADIGFTFAAALRSILRHDPDIILVGEMRDEETARIAIQSALTGHLVLSTLHTNSAIGAVTRLADMGIEPFLIAASLRGLMAQRLVRALCPQCTRPDEAPDEALRAMFERFAVASSRPMAAVGCEACSGTGFRGRLALYDLIEVDDELGHRIAQGRGEGELLSLLGPHAAEGLLASGVAAVAAGRTTLSEVLKAIGSG